MRKLHLDEKKTLHLFERLKSLDESEIEELATALDGIDLNNEEVVYRQSDPDDCAYVVISGTCRLEVDGRVTAIYLPGDIFGAVALIDPGRRAGSVIVTSKTTLGRLSPNAINERISSHLRANLYRLIGAHLNRSMQVTAAMFKEFDVLMIQEGGCAPGYNAVTASLVEKLEQNGRATYVAAEGFRSLISNKDSDYRCLIHDSGLFDRLDHIPGVVFAPPLREARGANFRSERFPEFKNSELQSMAAKNIMGRNTRAIIAIGGNGTLKGAKSLATHLEDKVPVFFIPVTIDSDVSGTACIGEYTGIEIGSEKIRCYMADARTHNRLYIIEMMGAHGGYHALHSCLGAGAHLAVLPGQKHDMSRLIPALNSRNGTVIVVAEGYGLQKRHGENYSGNAAEWFKDELLAAGLTTQQKIVCEPFSRDIRGASPNHMDLMLAQRMARSVTTMILDGDREKMPTVNQHEEGSLNFRDITTDNSTTSSLASLANRLYVPTQ